MKTYDSIKWIEQHQEVVEAHLELAIARFQNMREPELNKKPSIDSWSIAQNLYHLNTYGLYYLPKIESAINDYLVKNTKGVNTKSFKSSWLGAFFTKDMHPDTSKRKYKAFKAHIPPPMIDAYKEVQIFIEHQELLLKLLKKANEVDLGKIKLSISISKWVKLNLGDVFGFFVAHNERHIAQVSQFLDEPKNR
jgi:hypothetical protein